MIGNDAIIGGLQWVDDRPFYQEVEVDKAFLE